MSPKNVAGELEEIILELDVEENDAYWIDEADSQAPQCNILNLDEEDKAQQAISYHGSLFASSHHNADYHSCV